MRTKVWLLSLVHGMALAIFVVSIMSYWSAEQERLEMSTVEAYDSRLGRIQTIDQVMRELEGTPAKTELDRVLNLEHLLRERFYYGYARYSFRENWIAWLAARTVNPDLDAKTDAREIIESPWAACSQQAIVVQEVLKRWRLPYASVLFPKHFTAAVQIDRTWYIVDPWEPLERDRSRLFTLADWQSPAKRATFLSPAAQVAWEPGLKAQPPRLAHVNRTPAPTMAWFQPLTELLSKWLWLPALLVLLLRARSLMAGERASSFRTFTRQRGGQLIKAALIGVSGR